LGFIESWCEFVFWKLIALFLFLKLNNHLCELQTSASSARAAVRINGYLILKIKTVQLIK